MCALHYANSIWQKQNGLYTKLDEIYRKIKSIHKPTISFQAYLSECSDIGLFFYLYLFFSVYVYNSNIICDRIGFNINIFSAAHYTLPMITHANGQPALTTK